MTPPHEPHARHRDQNRSLPPWRRSNQRHVPNRRAGRVRGLGRRAGGEPSRLLRRQLGGRERCSRARRRLARATHLSCVPRSGGRLLRSRAQALAARRLGRMAAHLGLGAERAPSRCFIAVVAHLRARARRALGRARPLVRLAARGPVYARRLRALLGGFLRAPRRTQQLLRHATTACGSSRTTWILAS